MKNILVALLLLAASQMLVAVTQDMKLELNEPKEYNVRIPVIDKSFTLYGLEKDVRDRIEVRPNYIKISESKIREEGSNPTICFTGDCGIEDNNKIKSQIIIVK